MDLERRGLGQIPTAPGMVTVILNTPLGNWIVDPFAPPDPTIDRIMKLMGINVELRMGGPRPEDVDAPKLSTGLVMLGAFAGFMAWNYYWSRCRR